MNDEFWKRLLDNLAATRRRRSLLQVIALVLAVATALCLAIARAAWDEGGANAIYQWPALICALVSGAMLVLVYSQLDRMT